MKRYIIIAVTLIVLVLTVLLFGGHVMGRNAVTYDPIPFQSTQELTEWVDKWEAWDIAFGVYDLSSRCENGAWAMFIDMVNQNRLAGFQIDPHRQHMVVIVPIPAENCYKFVDERRVTGVFAGREWRIN